MFKLLCGFSIINTLKFNASENHKPDSNSSKHFVVNVFTILQLTVYKDYYTDEQDDVLFFFIESWWSSYISISFDELKDFFL